MKIYFCFEIIKFYFIKLKKSVLDHKPNHYHNFFRLTKFIRISIFFLRIKPTFTNLFKFLNSQMLDIFDPNIFYLKN